MSTRRTIWVILVALPVVLIAGDIVYWQIAAGRLRAGYEHWLAERANEGWQSEAGPPFISGWPRAATIAIPNITLRHRGPAIPGDLEVAASGVTVSVSLFRPETLRISVLGPTRVRVGNAADVVLASDEDWLSVGLRQGPPYLADLHANNLRIASGPPAWQASVGLLDLHATITTGAAAPQAPAGDAVSPPANPEATRPQARGGRGDATAASPGMDEQSAPPRDVLVRRGGDCLARGDQMAAGAEYFLALAGRPIQREAAGSEQHHRLGRGVAR